MKVNISNVSLEQVLDFDELKDLFKHFVSLTGIDVSLHNIQGQELFSHRVAPELSICEKVINQKNVNICEEQMAYAGLKAAELGEPYIFKCGCMIKSSAPIFFEEKMIGSLSCGPVLLWDADELAFSELKKITSSSNLSDDEIREIIKNVKQLSCENMTSASKMLSIIVDHMCKEESRFMAQRLKITKQQNKIAELLLDKKQSMASLIAMEKRTKFRKYPIEMEKELIAYVQTGDTNNARRMLNDLLGEILSFSSGNLDIVKAKLFELITIIFRAGVDSGSPLPDMSILLKDYTKVLTEDISFEELCLQTSEVMELIMGVIYQSRSEKKTNENLVKAIQYIKQNYHQELSLDIVAKNVFVSNYYLSHLFRNELDMTFSDYVNKIRMEQSIQLMKLNDYNVQIIAEKVGFNDAGYFSRTFKKYYGVSPNSYLKIYRT